jgi:hypothetical protein
VLAGIGIQFVPGVDGRSWHSSKKATYFPKALRTDGGSSSASQDGWTIAIQSQQGTATDAVVLFASL